MNIKSLQVLVLVLLTGAGWIDAAARGAASENGGINKAITAPTAEQAVELATQEILGLIELGKSYAEEDPERFYTEVEVMLRPLIDFPRFARNVMGAYYRKADDAQRERFAESFKWSLVRTYALALTEFGGGKIEVLEPRRPPRDPNKVGVTMEIQQNGNIYVVVYQMQRDASEAWRLRNLVIEGVNIGLNYKSQFAAAMKDPANGRDLDAVIDAWTEVIEAEDKAGADRAGGQARAGGA